MPFPFVPSTTSHLIFQTNFASTTHPSLPAAATSRRNVLRSALKTYKRLSVTDQASHLSSLTSCLSEYLQFLNTINTALSGKAVAGEDIDIALAKEVEVEWRPTLLPPAVPGREPDRLKGRGLDYEIFFVHHTFAVVQTLLARQSLLGLYAASSPPPEQRLAMIQSATKALRTAYSLHYYLNQLSAPSSEGPASFPPSAIDISPSTQSSLQRLAASEINLLAALKDDPYPALLAQSRNETDKEWMIKAPTIPKMRTQVLTRLCIGAAEHAAATSASLKVEGRKMSKDIIEYAENIRCTARARACRFQALDSNLAGQTGKAIAWLYAGLNELGVEVNTKEGANKASKLDRLRTSWNERREDRRIAKADPKWGIDGGKAEEVRIIEYLEKKYSKENNTINIQVIPEWRPLLAMLPSGMNLPIEDKWKINMLSEEDLSAMRAPPEERDINGGESSSEDDQISTSHDRGVVGAFPATEDEYAAESSYY